MADDGGRDERGLDLARQWATWGLVGLNIAVFLALVLAGASPFYAPNVALAGGVEPGHVWDGELWRLLTACFVHLGIWHLALNMWVLWQLGRALESMIGGARLLLIYASSGVFGFATSLSLHAGPTAGASGAVFGVTGALLALALIVRHKRLGRLLFSALLPFVGATFALGVLVPLIDNTAHLGGLVFGFLIGYGLSAGDRSFDDDDDDDDEIGVIGARERVLGTVALALSGLLFAGVVVYSARPVLSPRYHAIAGLADLARKQIDGARAHAKSAARLAPEDAATFILLGRIRADTAKSDADKAEARRLVRAGVDKIHEGDANARFTAALFALSQFGGGTDELPYDDHKTVDAVCDAVLDAVGTASSPEVKNNCAWLKLKSPTVHDPVRGLALAQAAVKESGGKDGNIVQTLSEALSQNGQAAEGLALLEKLQAEGHAGEVTGGEDFIASERRRLERMAVEQARAPLSPGDARPADHVGSP